MRLYPWLLLLLLGGCALRSSGSGGNGATPTLRYDNCSSDCELWQNAVAAGGAHTTILVSGVRFATVTSSNPAVATFTPNGSKVEVESGVAGTTELQLFDTAGRVVAAGTVSVVPTAELRVNRGWSGAAPLVLEGETMVFHVTTLDAAGHVTKGDGSVQFALSAPLERTISVLDGDAVAFRGVSPGAGAVTATCPDATLTQAITVVPATAVTTLQMTAEVEPNDQAVVTAVPQSASGPVYAGKCDWQTSDPSVTLDAEIAPLLDLGAGTIAVFNLNRAGSYTITCTAAGQSATVTVSR